ncbi:hypothetical protein [Streptomyces boluensis]|uniref:Uncharacterized protein n=1 Tax=Streptomyces boluensis TaxID=1775135 RepID=A0A964UW85_9ACTN|nr:hypothetical protein [Streptomyces boluensis]NBE52755.1 hypothetical protein [Streptomyces boluensis]
MPTLTHNEQLHLASLREIEGCPLVEAQCSGTGLSRSLAHILPEEYDDAWEGVQFSSAMVRCSLRFYELGAAWQTLPSLPEVVGEFSLGNFHDALQCNEGIPEDATTEFHHRFLTQLRPVDRTPRYGAGMQTYIRMQPDVEELELWYTSKSDIGQPPHPPGYIKLDLTYHEYLEALLLTKGAYSWQYLFADISLNRPDFSDDVNNLTNMLRVFPEIFPEHDYTQLSARLEARL